MTVTDNDLLTNAAAVLEKLTADAAEIRAEIEVLHTRLEVVDEVIALLAGSGRRSRPKGGGRKAAVTMEVVEPIVPEISEIVP